MLIFGSAFPLLHPVLGFLKNSPNLSGVFAVLAYPIHRLLPIRIGLSRIDASSEQDTHDVEMVILYSIK